MALTNQPMYQRAMQKHLAKASMSGRRPNTFAVQAQAANQDIARKQAFAGLGLSKKRSDLAHKGRMASFNLQRDQMKDAKSQLPWTLGMGAAGALMSAWEGRRRAKSIAEQTANQREWMKQFKVDTDTNRYLIQDMRRWGSVPNFK